MSQYEDDEAIREHERGIDSAEAAEWPEADAVARAYHRTGRSYYSWENMQASYRIDQRRFANFVIEQQSATEVTS